MMMMMIIIIIITAHSSTSLTPQNNYELGKYFYVCEHDRYTCESIFVTYTRVEANVLHVL